MYILQVAADVVNSGVSQKNPGKVLLTNGGQAFGIGKELNLKYLCLQVVHESAERQRHICIAERVRPALNASKTTLIPPFLQTRTRC